MNKKTLWILVGIMVIVIVGFVVSHKPKSPELQPKPGANSVTNITFKNTTGDLSVFDKLDGSYSSDATVTHDGSNSIKLSTADPDIITSSARKNNVMGDAGRRVSYWFRFDTLPKRDSSISSVAEASVGSVLAVMMKPTGQIYGFGVNNATPSASAIGTASPNALAVNTWYRISFAYTVVSTTSFRMDVYVNGEHVSRVTNANGTLDRVGTEKISFLARNGVGPKHSFWFDDIYIDDGADFSDPGDIH